MRNDDLETGPHGDGPSSSDPVAERRAFIASWAQRGKRIGYLALVIAIAVFSVALYWDLPEALMAVIVACLVIATITLLPSIILGYGISAAERDDRDAAAEQPHRSGPAPPAGQPSPVEQPSTTVPGPESPDMP